MTAASEIRDRLNEIAPYKPQGGTTALTLARWLAMEAQVVWARMLDIDHAIDPRDIGTLHGYFAAAHTLLTLNAHNPQVAAEVARQIEEAFDSPGDVGEWLWEFHGDHAKEIVELAAKLTTLTQVSADGHVREKEQPESVTEMQRQG